MGGVVTYVGSEHARLENDTRTYLAEIVNRLTASGLSVEVSVRQGEPGPAVAEAAAAHGAAAVVMATHGLTGVARTILGSVAGEVLHRSPSPVLLIRPAELRAAEEPVKSQVSTSPAPA